MVTIVLIAFTIEPHMIGLHLDITNPKEQRKLS